MTGMTNEQILARVQNVFRDVFDDESIVVTRETYSADIEDWDSLMHITLVGAVEDEFGFKFAMKDVVGMQNVGEMIDIIAKQATK